MIASIAAAAPAFFLRATTFAALGPLARTACVATTYLGVYLLLTIVILRVRVPLRTTQTLIRGYLPPRLAYLVN